jgi:nucleoside-diphosphate-sugar epimerase
VRFSELNIKSNEADANYAFSKKIIVTGATGLIGKEALAPLKELGFEIYAITIDEKTIDVKGVKWINVNLLDSKKVQEVFAEIKPQYLLHFAWVVTGDYLMSNMNFEFVQASLDLLKYFNENGGKRAVFAGSYFEYDFKDSPLKESDKLNPLGIYGKCKNYTRELAELFCQNNGISFGWGRIFNVFGRNENKNRLTGSIIDKLSRNEDMIIKSGDLHKDYMYAKDVAGAFAAFVNSDVEGIVNICTGNAITIAEYAKIFASKMKKEHLLKFISEPNNQPPYVVGDNTLLTEKVKYNIKYTLETAVEEILEDIEVSSNRRSIE